MTGRIRTQAAIVPLLLIALIAACLLSSAACTTSNRRGGCHGSEKCPGPPLPPATVHLGIGDTFTALGFGATTHAYAERGVPIRITLSVEHSAAVTVSNVWLVVQRTHGGTTEAVPNAPFTHFIVVLGRKGLLGSTETLATSWIPTAASGTNDEFGVSLTVGDAGVSWPIATVTV